MSRIKLADINEPDIDPGLRPALENMEQIAGKAINGLREANETRLLQNLMPQWASYMPYDTRKLLIKCDEAVKWLRVANAQNLLQRLAKFEMPLSTPNLANLSSQAEIARSNLTCAQATRLLTNLTHEPAFLRIPYLAILEEASKTANNSLRNVNEFRQLENLARIAISFDLPPLAQMKSACNKTGALLKEAYELRLSKEIVRYPVPLQLPNLDKFTMNARLVTGDLQSAHEAKILVSICKQEQKREKILKQCYFHAEWAGSDLQRWERVFGEYGKYPKHLKILNGLIEEAHSRFLLILAETRNLEEIEERCHEKPFLVRETAVLKGILEGESGLNEAPQEKREEEIKSEQSYSVGPK